ncbi:MAG TPA: Amuc_1100 family pilus-like protein [Verrucomicrobiae bacterium]|jgi:hypothetical protein
MEWLKRNLFFIGWGALAVGLTVVAFFFLFSQTARDAELHESLEQKRQELVRIYGSDPQPSPTNLAKIKDEQAQAQKLIADSRKLFAATVTEKIDSAAFKKLLEDSVFQLTRDAQAARVELPRNYGFTFASARIAVQFSRGSLEPLVARLNEIKTLCRILYDARVHSLDGVRRVAISADDTAGAEILPDQKPTTNQITGMVSYPYEVTFTGFSRELGVLLDAFQKEPLFFVVKTVTVDPAPGTSAPPPSQPGAAPPAAPVLPEGTTDAAPPAAFRAPTAPSAAAGPARPGGPVTILDEKLLRITLALDVVVPAAAK